MAEVVALTTETKSRTELGKTLVGLAQRLDTWCEAETNITRRQARMAIALAAVGGAAVIAGWDNSWYHYVSNNLIFVPEGREVPLPRLGGSFLTDVVKSLVTGSVNVTKFSYNKPNINFVVNLSPEQRTEALNALLKVEGRQVAKSFTAELAFLAGVGVAAAGRLLGSKEKIKGSTGVGQWTAGFIKSIGEVL